MKYLVTGLYYPQNFVMVIQSEQFNFIYQNIRSMRRNSDKLFAYVDSVQERPLIIGLSEVWIYNAEYRDYEVNGYNLFLNGNSNIRSGGVAIYACNKLNCIQLAFNFRTFDALGVQFSLNSKKMAFVCIYRFGFTNISDFIEEFSVLLNDLTHINLFIVGDFNFDLLLNNASNDKFLVLLSNNGLVNLVSEPTRITDTSATCIDNVLFRIDHRSFREVLGTVQNLKISDHCLIAFEVASITITRETTVNSKLSHNRTDYGKLKNLLLAEDWGVVYACSDASCAFDKFMKIFGGHLNNCIISRHSICSGKLKPWMNDYLLGLLRKRNKFCRLAKKHTSNLRLNNYSLKLCELVNQKITSTKKHYYTIHFQENGKDARKNWRLVNEIISGQTEQACINVITDETGSSTTDAYDISNKFNEFFTSVGDDGGATAFSPTAEFESIIFENDNPINSFFFSPVTPGELYGIINTLKNSSSPGLDGITNSLIKKMACYLVDILSHIFNLSVNSGVFPVSLKRAVVIPIYKKNDKTCLNNYRPISLLSVFSKILEKTMKRRVVDFLDDNFILSDLQFGFRENKNTEMALLSFLEVVTNSIDLGLKTSALFVDMTKAFDRVNHSLLLRKLYLYGIRGDICKWFQSYLHGRTQCVRVNGHLSKNLPIKVGVPQGSVLGPLLFLVYINGIFSQRFLGSIIAFADDLSLSYANSNFHLNVISINHDLDLLSRWMSAHNMRLSEKTKLLHFRERQSMVTGVNYHVYACNINLPCSSYGCFPIERVHDFRYLGVHIDENLNWKEHIDSLKSKLLLVARKMYVLRRFAPNYLLRTVYFALVDSLLQYGLACWGGACYTTLDALYVRQKHIIRIICFRDRLSPSWPIFQALNVLPLQHMFVFKVLRLFFNMSGNDFVNHFDYNLRSNCLFKKLIPKFKLDLRKYSFSVISPLLFNNLPLDIRSSRSFSVFSKNLLIWLRKNNTIQKLFSISV